MKKSVKILLIIGALALAVGIGLGAFFIGRGSQTIGRDAALNIALADLGLDRGGVTDVDVELERRKGASAYYEVDFDLISDGSEVQVRVDAATGAVLGKNAEGGALTTLPAEPPAAPDQPAAPADAPSGNTEPTVSAPAQAPSGREETGTLGGSGADAASQSGQNYIGRDAALAAALADAGLAESEVYDIDVDLELRRNSGAAYEVDFDTPGTDYKYLIDALTGEILSSRAEAEDLGAAAPAAPSGEDIGRDAALAAALADAGLTESEVYDIDVELDRDGGLLRYEVDFETAVTEYEYDIDPYTGEILRSHTEPRD